MGRTQRGMISPLLQDRVSAINGTDRSLCCNTIDVGKATVTRLPANRDYLAIRAADRRRGPRLIPAGALRRKLRRDPAKSEARQEIKSVRVRKIAFDHVKHMANRFLPDQIAIHGSSRHILNDVLNRRHSAGVDVLVRSPRRTSERVTARPFKLVIAHDRVTAPLNDVIQRVRIVSMRYDVLAWIDNLDTEEYGRQHTARFPGIRIDHGNEPPVRAAKRILSDFIKPRLEVAPAPDRRADILFDEERIILVVGHKLRPLSGIRIFHVRARISRDCHYRLVHQRPPFLFEEKFYRAGTPFRCQSRKVIVRSQASLDATGRYAARRAQIALRSRRRKIQFCSWQ